MEDALSGLRVVVEEMSAHEAPLLEADAQTKAARRKLAEETKKLREIPTAERSKAIGPLLKLYQGEIDSLTKRGNKASKAYFKLLGSARDCAAQDLSAAQPPPERDDSAPRLAAFESTLSRLEAELAVETPPGTPIKPLSASSTEEVSGRLERLSSSAAGSQAALTRKTLELAEISARLTQVEVERDARGRQLEQVTAAMEREAQAKAEAVSEGAQLREQLAAAAASASSAAGIDTSDWETTVGQLQDQLRSMHEESLAAEKR
jgi:homeobox protein cut-like